MIRVFVAMVFLFLCSSFLEVEKPIQNIEILLTKESDGSTFSIGKTDKNGIIKPFLNKGFYDLRISDGKRKRMKFKLWVRVSSIVNGNPISISTEIEETEGFGFAVIEGQTVTLSVYLINK